MTLQNALIATGIAALAAGLILLMVHQRSQASRSTVAAGDVDDLEFTELEFFALASDLPDEYSRYLSPDCGRDLVVPGRNGRLGDLRVGVLPHVFRIQLGDHTQFDFRTPYDAIEFVADVLADRIGFQIAERGASQFRLDDESEVGDLPGDLEVWSGNPPKRQPTR